MSLKNFNKSRYCKKCDVTLFSEEKYCCKGCENDRYCQLCRNSGFLIEASPFFLCMTCYHKNVCGKCGVYYGSDLCWACKEENVFLRRK